MKKLSIKRILVGGTASLLLASSVHAASIVNGSFESGFTGWIPTDMVDPFDPLHVGIAGEPTAFDGFGGTNPGTGEVTPTDGLFAVTNGFDGGGPGVISVAQDIGVVAVGDVLEYDFRAGWDMGPFGGTADRLFGVDIEPFGGGAPLFSFTDLTALAGSTVFDTGPLSAAHDLSPFAGVPIRINFIWDIPESFTGPANAQLDHVRIVSAVPENGVGFVVMITMLSSLFLLRSTGRR